MIKFKNNRVRRNYNGGKELDKLQNIQPAVDSNQPEEWIASLVSASNEGLKFIKNEGLSIADNGDIFTELIKKIQ